MEKLRKEELAEKPSAIKIKALRTERNMTQKEFSKWLEIPIQTLKQWELGLRSAPKWLLNLIEYRCKKATQGNQINIFDKEVFLLECNEKIQYVYTTIEEARKWENFCRNVSKYEKVRVYVAKINQEI